MGQDQSEGERLEDKVVNLQAFAGSKTIRGSQPCIRSALTLVYQDKCFNATHFRDCFT